MTPQGLFSFLSFSPGPFWLGLMLFPRSRIFRKAFDTYLWLLLGIFAIRAIPAVPGMIPLLSNPSFEAMQSVFQTPEGFLSGWNHFIIGDLWFGRYIAADSARERIPAWIRVLALIVTLYFGPLGLFCYLAVRFMLRRNVAIWSDRD